MTRWHAIALALALAGVAMLVCNGAPAPRTVPGTVADARPPSSSLPATQAPAPPRAAPQPPVQDAADVAAAELRPKPALRAAFERESPDAFAHETEADLRAIYEGERDADMILREVRCTRSVCRVDLRWSPELNAPYNRALNHVLQAFTRDIDLTPDVALGGPQMPIPMTLFVARPGHSVESLWAQQAASLPDQR